MSATRRRVARAAAIIVAIVVVLAIAVPNLPLGGSGAAAIPSPTQDASPSPSPSTSPSPSPTPRPTPSPTPRPTPTPTPPPTPTPTPAFLPAPLTGHIVPSDLADDRVIAVMVDDHPRARPQSGFNAAGIVWHAPAEYGIPRYMMLFQDTMPGAVGPVRSARLYFLAWASEWQPLYGHVGGSPQARELLAERGDGDLVYDADEPEYAPTYFWRISSRRAPHNAYTDGRHLRDLAEALGAGDRAQAPIWTFATEAPLAGRPSGAALTVRYDYNTVRYEYERLTNRWIRSVDGAWPQVDAADGEAVAPTNVVVLFVPFRPLDDGHPDKGRQEADFIGTGRALVATNGVIADATWSKAALDGPTLLLDAEGRPVTLTRGQTFVQVVPAGTHVPVTRGRAVPTP